MSTVRIGLCAHRTIEPQTLGSLFSLAQVLGPNVSLHLEAGADVAFSREKIVREFQGDYLLFVDSDMTFTPRDVDELYKALMEDPKIGAVSAHYVKWDGTEETIGNWKKEDGSWLSPEEKKGKVSLLSGSKEVSPVDSFGGGLLLISREALEALDRPIFRTSWDEHGYVGNDTHLCRRLQEAGYHPSIHFGVLIGHIGPRLFTPPNGEN